MCQFTSDMFVGAVVGGGRVPALTVLCSTAEFFKRPREPVDLERVIDLIDLWAGRPTRLTTDATCAVAV